MFQVAGQDAAGHANLQRAFTRLRLLRFTAPCHIGTEACGRPHWPVCELIVQGQDARLMPGQYVRPRGHLEEPQKMTPWRDSLADVVVGDG